VLPANGSDRNFYLPLVKAGSFKSGRDRLIWNLDPTFRTALSLLICSASIAAVPPVVCPAGSPVGLFELSVRSARGGEREKPLRTINRLEEGDMVVYRPILRAGEERKGEVALALALATPAANGEMLQILDPQKANKTAEWTIPRRIGVVAFVYGPSGLNRKKVRTFLSRDQELIAQLAEYADKTAQAEALIAALSSPNSSADAVQSALRGFSSQYGFSVQLNRDAPPDQQAMMLFRTLNPAISRYDPIGAPQRTQMVAQTAGLATSVAALFFGNPVSLAAGGTAMALQLGSMAFPNAEFRSSFAQSIPGSNGMALCGQRHAAPPNTRVVYLWASRIPNIDPPKLALRPGVSAAAGVKSPLPVAATPGDWEFADRALFWELGANGFTRAIRVTKLGPENKLELDIPAEVPPGVYKLSANWDWQRFDVEGDVVVRPLPDLAGVALDNDSHDRLVAKSGKQVLRLEGADFEFVTRVELTRPGDRFFAPVSVPFVLPKGLREGPQDHVDVQIDTDALEAGAYELRLTQVDGQARPLPLTVLTPPPAVANFPVRLNQGSEGVSVVLTGERLDQIERIEAPKATIELGEPSPDGRQRPAHVRVSTDVPAGTSLAAKAFWKGRIRPREIADAIRVTNPLPAIHDASVSHEHDTGVELYPGELPGASYLSAILRVSHLQPETIVRLGCEQQNTTTVVLKLGQSYGGVRLQQVAADQLFLSFDTGVWLNGCRLQAVIVNPEGESAPRHLGRVVRAPKIERVEFNGQTALVGQNLETVAMISWTPDAPEVVTALPLPLSAENFKQKLPVCLPAPPEGQGQLYVWLRGEDSPRLARIGS
jgi:hypothetical protein